MPLAPGTRLGPYEILAPLGAGGMGEVYRARDSRLGREVAIKVLPAHLSDHPEVRARFEREAKTVSSLNHPNICTLFDVGREGGTDYLVMELVEGETLAQRLARGPLPAADVLRVGREIAGALERAHKAGVIHRDLKPGNVMLTKTGAKLMDFGLARAVGLAGVVSGSGATVAALTHSPTIAQPLTAEGTIIGTFQYMAPEQLEGHEADARSDLWALGCVLYEMATGRRAFDGPSQASLISAIMKDEPPPVSNLAPLAPPGLDRLVRQCLAKDPDERWQSAGDVRRELDWLAGGGTAGVATPLPGTSSSTIVLPAPAAPPRARADWSRVALAAVAVLAVMFALLKKPSSGTGGNDGAGTLARFTISAPAGESFAKPAEAELSPDGRAIVFGAADSTGTLHLMLRTLANPEARALPGTDEGNLPFWSPDSRMIGFFARGKLWTMALDGSAPAALCDARNGRGATWSRSGVILFAPTSQSPIMRVPAGGGAPIAVTRLDSTRHELGHRYPQFLPDGKHFLYVGIGSGEEQSTFVTDLDGAKPVEVCRAGSGARYAAPGWLLYLDAGVNAPQKRLLARRFDAGRGRATGDPQLVLGDVDSNNFGYSNVSSAPGGELVAQHWQDLHERLTWRDRNGTSLGAAVEDLDGRVAVLSPDGRRLAYSGNRDLFVLDLASGVSRRLTFENQTVSSIVWSPDARRIAFARLFGARGWEAHVKSADGTGPDSLVYHGPGLFNYPQSWSPDGRWLVALCSDATGAMDLWKIPMIGAGTPEPYQHTAAGERDGFVSRDGRWLLYTAVENGVPGVFVQSFPEPGAKYQIALPHAVDGLWLGNDEILVQNDRDELFAIRISAQDGSQQGGATRLFRPATGDQVVDIAPDGRRILVATPLNASALSQLEVVLGWPQLLAKR